MRLHKKSPKKKGGSRIKKLRIALVQMKCRKAGIMENLAAIEKYTAECQQKGAEVVCFPEMSLSGYVEPDIHPEVVISLDDKAVKKVIAYSNTYRVCIIAGFIEYNPEGKPFITQFAARNGELLAYYRKKTIKDEEAAWFSPGEAVAVFAIRGVKIGLAVCADIDDPEIFQTCAARGAGIVLECAAPGLYGEQQNRNWQSGYNWWRDNCRNKLGKYAADNAIYIAVATQAGRTIDEDFPGGGYVFNPEGECIQETEEWQEGILYAVLG